MGFTTIVNNPFFTLLLIFLSYSGIAQTPFWTETFSSETDFNANWTNGGTNDGPEDWVWSDQPGALLFGAQPPFGSTTADDGFVIFNSDGNGNFSHDVTITSPVIDCSGQNQVFLRCENQYGFFSTGGISIAEVGVSTNGTDFTYYEILTEVEQNALADAVQVVYIELPEAANQSTVSIQFRWQGVFEYTWRIDDINLFSENPQPINNLEMIQPRVAPNFATPASQTDTVVLGFGITNSGLADQPNVTATASVSGDNGDNFTTTESTAVLEADSSVFFTFDETFLPTGEGTFTVNYATASDSTDASPDNNAAEATFIVTEDLYSKDDGNVVNATQPAEVNNDVWEIGNYYVVPTEGYEAFEAEISVASQGDAHQGQTVTVFLYAITEDSDVANFTDDDLTVLGFGEYTFTTEENFELVTVELFDLLDATQGIVLDTESTEYFLTIQYTPEMLVPYSGLSYFYDVATVVKGDGDDWFLGGFGPDVTAVARMRIREAGSVAVKEPELAEDQIKVFPNPTANQLTVGITLENLSDQVELKIVDAVGRNLYFNTIEDVKSEQFSIDVKQFPAGNYFLHVRSAEGVSTERFIIQR